MASPEPSQGQPAPLQLSYQRADESRPRRPVWVFVLVLLYLLGVAALLLSPAYFLFGLRAGLDSSLLAAGVVTLLSLCGTALLWIPVRKARQRPVGRLSIIYPMLAAGVILGGLAAAAGMALAELCWTVNLSQTQLLLSLAPGVAIWIGWSLLLWVMGLDWGWGWAERLKWYLLAGSFLELVVAVPCHLIVRRRSQCCAGMYTGTAICLGIAIAIVSMGPVVALLYYRRWQRLTLPPTLS